MKLGGHELAVVKSATFEISGKGPIKIILAKTQDGSGWLSAISSEEIGGTMHGGIQERSAAEKQYVDYSARAARVTESDSLILVP